METLRPYLFTLSCLWYFGLMDLFKSMPVAPLIVCLYALACVGVAHLGKDKKIGDTDAYLLSAFLSPLVGILVVSASVKKQ